MTYDEYLTVSAGKIPEAQFKLYSSRAENLLLKVTGGRLYECGTNSSYAIAELAESCFSADTRDGIIREVNDGYSVEYSSAAKPVAEAKRIARIWLSEEVLYSGVKKCDCRKC